MEEGKKLIINNCDIKQAEMSHKKQPINYLIINDI
jgi:hypothetical protein